MHPLLSFFGPLSGKMLFLAMFRVFCSKKLLESTFFLVAKNGQNLLFSGLFYFLYLVHTPVQTLWSKVLVESPLEDESPQILEHKYEV